MSRRIVVAGAVLMLAAAACVSADPTTEELLDALPTLSVTMTDDGEGAGHAFESDMSVPAGPTILSAENTGAEMHHAQLFQLDADKTMDDVGAALATGDPFALLDVGVFAGGTAPVSPGGTSSADAIVDFQPGTYAFMCFIDGPEGAPHVATGMLMPFEVEENDDPAEAPTADEEVQLIDTDEGFAFDGPTTVASDAVVNVRNSSTEITHEMNIFRMDEEDMEIGDVVEILTGDEEADGPPPITGVGGMQGLVPGASQLLALDLDDGDYAIICVIPNDEGVPHARLGMVQQLTVG